MAQAIIMKGGSGGVTSKKVTAAKEHVLSGYRTITSDSGNKVVEGTMVNHGAYTDAESIVADGSQAYIRVPKGAYLQHTVYGLPEITVPFPKMATVLGVDSAKMLQSLIIAGRQGQIVDRGNGMDTVELTNAPWLNGFIARMEQGFYQQQGQWKPYVSIPYTLFAQVAGVDPARMVESLTIAGRQGQIVDRGDGAQEAYAIGREDWAHRIWAVFRNGWYHRAPNTDGHEAYLYISFGQLAALLGVDPAKMLQSLTIADVQGQIVDRGSFVDGDGVWYYGDGGVMVAQILPGYHGNGNGSGKTNVHIKREIVMKGIGLNPDYWLDSFSTMGIQGKIPRWVCNTTDILETENGFAYTDNANGRGQGIVMAIKNGHRIEGANWIFMRVPNLQPPNIRAGVNIAGVTGTMPDYGAGGVVFHNATFNGVFSSGVADKGLAYGNLLCMPHWNAVHRFYGIADGGLKYGINETYTAMRIDPVSNKIGSTLNRSINFAPFRYLDIEYRVFGTIYTFIDPKTVSLFAYITSIANMQRGQVTIDGAPRPYVRVSRILTQDQKIIAQGDTYPRQNKWVDETSALRLNVSGINEHAFVSWGVGSGYKAEGTSVSLISDVSVIIKAIRLVP